MDISELKIQLDLAKVDKRFYSLEGEFIIDCIILYSYDSKWEVFYLDERGNRNDEKIFYKESEMCDYILKLLTTDY